MLWSTARWCAWLPKIPSSPPNPLSSILGSAVSESWGKEGDVSKTDKKKPLGCSDKSLTTYILLSTAEIACLPHPLLPHFAHWGRIVYEIAFRFLFAFDFTIFLFDFKIDVFFKKNHDSIMDENLNATSETILLQCVFEMHCWDFHTIFRTFLSIFYVSKCHFFCLASSLTWMNLQLKLSIKKCHSFW